MQGRLGPAIAAEGGMESIKMAGRLTFERKTSKADMRGLNGPKELRLDLVDSKSMASDNIYYENSIVHSRKCEAGPNAGPSAACTQ